MGTMNLNISKVIEKLKSNYKKLDHQLKRIIYGVPLSFLMMVPSAFAQSVEGLCTIAIWYKTFAGAAALIAVIIYVVNSYFGKSSLVADIVQNVLIGCAVVVGAGALINATGLSSQCTI